MALTAEQSVHFLNQAWDLMLVVAAWEVTPHVHKLTTLGPVYECGICTCNGRLAKGLKNLIGREDLPILTKDAHLAKLMMIAAHKKNQDSIAGTL